MTPQDNLFTHSTYAAFGTPLTKREREVLHLTSCGLSRKELGVELGISPDTVKNHLQNTYAKLGARNAAHATRLFYG